MAYLCVNKNPLTYKSFYLNRNKYAMFMEFCYIRILLCIQTNGFLLLGLGVILCCVHMCALNMNFVP